MQCVVEEDEVEVVVGVEAVLVKWRANDGVEEVEVVVVGVEAIVV